MAKVGRPPKYQADFHPEDFLRLSEQGKTLAQIAKSWKVDRDTINEWAKVHKEFSVAKKRGREIAEAWYMDLGQAAMLGQAAIDGKKISINLGMFCWLTKNMFRWSDKMEVRDKSAIDTHRPLKDVSDEELDDM